MKRCFSIPAVMLAMSLVVLPALHSQTSAAPQSVYPFPLSAIRAQTGTPYYIALNNKILPWLKALDADRVLYIWRQEYGLPNGTTQAMGSWEAPTVLLRGHFTGHILSALALTYALTGDAALKAKEAYIVKCLDTCQRRDSIIGLTAGCLSAFGEQSYINLEAQNFTNLWAPWYSSHKIIAGLIDCYKHVGDTIALRLAVNMGHWAYNRLSKVSAATLNLMWGPNGINGEYGGYNESASELYLITGDTTLRKLARLFNNNNTTGPSLPNLAANIDQLNNIHANMNIPRVIGLLRMYDAYNADSARYLNAATNFFTMFDNHHRFCNAGASGNSGSENFLPLDGESGQIAASNSSESCPTYNIIKLCKVLFYHDQSAKYWDLADRGSENRILHNFNVVGSPTSYTAWSTYFCSPHNNASASVDNSDLGGGNFTCCCGTNLESPEKFYEGNFAYGGDTLFINSFIGSTLTWTAKGVTVAMQTMFPETDTVTITVTATGTVTMPIKIRAPYWKRQAWTISVNGIGRNAVGPGVINGKIPPSSYFFIGQSGAGSPIQSSWTGTNTIVLTIPQSPRFEIAKGSTTVGAIFFGPSVMTMPGASSFSTLSASTWSRPSATSATITMGGVTLTPWYRPTAAYNTYATPTNIPASWDSVMAEVPLPTGVLNVADAVPTMAVPSVKMVRSRLTISYSTPMIGDRGIQVRLFNAQGALVSGSSATLHNGERSVSFSRGRALSAGLYVCIVTTGTRTYRTSLMLSK